MSKSNIMSIVQYKIFYLCHSNFHVHGEVDGLWSMTFTTTDGDLFFKVKETLVSLEPGIKKCTSVTNDGCRNCMALRLV